MLEPQPCSLYLGQQQLRCGALVTRRYLNGWRCRAHAPAPQPAGRYCPPRLCYCGTCPVAIEKLGRDRARAARRDKSAGIRAAAAGQARAVAAASSWSMQARTAIEQLARTGRPFTSEDVTAQCGLPRGDVRTNANNAVGAVLAAASRRKIIVRTGKLVQSSRPTSHAATLTEWRGA